MIAIPSPLRLRLSSEALVANWRWLAAQSGGAACGAAIKADGYGLGAREVMRHLAAAGCRDFFVATRSEEHTSALQSLMRNSYAVFCLKKKNINKQHRLYAKRKKIPITVSIQDTT